jgi:hypothetical protein
MLMLFAPLFSSIAMAQAVTVKPEIIDLTTGTPSTGSNFTVLASVTAASGVSYARLYLWFRIPGGVTKTQYIIMDSSPSTATSSDYESTFEVPFNATSVNYYITAYDTSNVANNTNALSRPVQDNILPVAVCSTNFVIDMGQNITFNGSASTDNVGIANYTWSFSYDGRTVLLYTPSPIFRFQLPGQYGGSLTVKDSWGNSAVLAFQINVTDTESPVADAGIQLFVNIGFLTFLDGSASTDNVGIANYTWEFTHNGTAAKLYGVSPSFIFRTAGVYELTLTVTDAAGNTDTAFLPVQVLNPTPAEGGLPWWTYILLVMIIVIVILAIIILRT